MPAVASKSVFASDGDCLYTIFDVYQLNSLNIAKVQARAWLHPQYLELTTNESVRQVKNFKCLVDQRHIKHPQKNSANKGLLTLSQHFLSHFEIYINKFSEFKLFNAFDEQLHHYTTGDSPLELRHSKLASASRNPRFLTWIGVFNTWSRLFRTDRWESSWYAWATGRRVRRTWHRSTSHHQ